MEDNKKVTTDLPKFKYHPDPLKTGSIELKETECPVCGKHSNYSYFGPFYSYEYEGEERRICPNCIADGSAAKKYEGEFTTIDECDVENDDYKNELTKKTPGFYSIQEDHWMDHCGDFCEFIGKIGQVSGVEIGEFIEDIVPDDIQEVLDILRIEKDNLEEFMRNHGDIQGYLFKCLKCGKKRFYIDFE